MACAILHLKRIGTGEETVFGTIEGAQINPLSTDPTKWPNTLREFVSFWCV